MNEQQQAEHDKMNKWLKRGFGDTSIAQPTDQAAIQMGDWMRQSIGIGAQQTPATEQAPAGDEVAK